MIHFGKALANPRLPPEVVAPLRRFFDASSGRWAEHLAVASSGTTQAVPGRNKWVLLSRAALEASAAAVNAWLASDRTDVWVQPLPEFHVGGIGIWLRARLSGARVVRFPIWNARGFAETCAREGVTLASLVPTQLFDLVAAGASAPATVRAVVIGGGALERTLYDDAVRLGWPVLPSYGMSECGSQIATARPGDARLRVLPHVALDTIDERLRVRSASLFTGYLYVENGTCRFEDPKIDGAFLSEDRGEISDGVLRLLGRCDDRIKISGENVELARLDALLAALAREAGFAPGEAALVAVPDDRLGHALCLAARREPQALIEKFNAAVLPFERIRRWSLVDAIPLSALGKVRRAVLAEMLRGT